MQRHRENLVLHHHCLFLMEEIYLILQLFLKTGKDFDLNYFLLQFVIRNLLAFLSRIQPQAYGDLYLLGSKFDLPEFFSSETTRIAIENNGIGNSVSCSSKDNILKHLGQFCPNFFESFPNLGGQLSPPRTPVGST